MLPASAASWTRGDLEGRLDDCARDATFVGSRGLTRGLDGIRESYTTGYWSTGAPEDGRRFQLPDIRPLGSTAAVTVGRYTLYDRDTDQATATGIFSLTLRRTADGWKIVHDHPSANEAA